MKELIKIETKGSSQVVSARELHKFLNIDTKFTTWCERMFDYGFVENQDYLLVSQKRETNNPKNPTTTETDYALTLDCAKQIAMLQRNEKGKEARQYFIQCEKTLAVVRTEVRTTALPHVLRSLEIGKELEVLELAKVELKKELAVLHRLAHGCRFCGKMNKSYFANLQHENYCKENPVALLSPNAQAKAYATSKKGGELC
jgi:anti-repressor protein